MKIHNLTDIETPKLAQHGVVKQGIVVGPKLIEPGASDDVADEHVSALGRGLQHLVSIGALAVGPQPPATYVIAKEKAKAAKPPVAPAAPEPVPTPARRRPPAKGE